VRRIPFTLSLALTIFVTTAVTGTLLRFINASELTMWGFSAADLAQGRWSHLALATFQIVDPYLALSMLVTVLALVGACEYRLGTGRTVLVYALSHVAGFLAIIAVAKVFAAGGDRWGRLIVAEPNVGASAGAIGAMGAWLMCLPRRLRRWGLSLSAAFLVAAFGGDVHAWDVAHVAAFVVGLGLGAVLQRDASVAAMRTRRIGVEERRTALAWIGIIVGVFAMLAPFAVIDGMSVPMAVSRLSSWGLVTMRWLFFIAGTALLASGPGLRRGERSPARFALIAGLVLAVMLWQPGAPGVEHILSIGLVMGLIVWRGDFQPSSAARSLRSAGGFAAVSIVSALTFVLSGFVALHEHFVPPLGWEGSWRMAGLRLRWLPIPTPNWCSPGARWFLQALPVVLYGSVLLAMYALVRSGFSRNHGFPAGSAGRSGRSE
jgi:hypothetical protein